MKSFSCKSDSSAEHQTLCVPRPLADYQFISHHVPSQRSIHHVLFQHYMKRHFKKKFLFIGRKRSSRVPNANKRFSRRFWSWKIQCKTSEKTCWQRSQNWRMVQILAWSQWVSVRLKDDLKKKFFCEQIRCQLTVFENHLKCRIWVFQLWHFLPISFQLK